MISRQTTSLKGGRAAACMAAFLLTTCLRTASGPLGGLLPALDSIRYTFSRPEVTASFAEKRAALEEARAVIDQARSEVLIWCYGFDEPELIGALADARRRHVRVRIVGSHDQSYSELEREGFLPEIRLRTGLQHAKLILTDRRRLFTGTGNFTTSDLFRSNNAFITVPVSESVAGEIIQAFDSENLRPDQAPTLRTGVHLLSGPAFGRGMELLLISAILEAQTSIRYLIFSHTDPLITAALAVQAARGVSIEGIYDDESESGNLPAEAARWNAVLGQSPVVLYLEGNRMGVPSDSGFRSGGKLHHKTIVIDSHRVLTGSFNWSASARDRNMELLLDIEDHFAAGEFLAEFERIRERATPMGRSALPGPGAPALSVAADSICSDRAGRMTTIRGRGAHIQARDYSVGVGCTDRASSLKAQAGYPGIAIAAGEGSVLFDLKAIQVEASSPTLCADPRTCRTVHLEQVRPEAGLFVLPEDSGLGHTNGIVRVVVAGKGAWSERGAALEVGPQTFSTDPWSHEAVLFLQTAAGDTFVGCVAYGAVLDTELDAWLDTFVAFGGMRPRCAKAP